MNHQQESEDRPASPRHAWTTELKVPQRTLADHACRVTVDTKCPEQSEPTPAPIKSSQLSTEDLVMLARWANHYQK